MPDWLKDAVFYEIYPQSFCDTNGDGIGDLNGITEKLEYIAYLGCNALWLNPIFDSPFRDAGYDVRDYYQIAGRYGTDEDFDRLIETAHARGIRVLLDLVPGHTSDEHAWFKASAEAEPNEYSGRYVWTSHAFEGIEGHPYISGMSERAGAYMLNFFASQPALNYGWGKRDRAWMSAPDSPEATATREDLKKVIRYWLDRGCDGFRVDMADSLVKNDDENKSLTAAVWRDVRTMLDKEYPQAALVSEWSNPYQAICLGGFHMDFYLDHHHNGYNTLLRDYETEGGDHSFFKAGSGGKIRRFLADYLPKYKATRQSGYISMFTCNHDTPRPALTLSQREMMLFAGFLMTMPGVPFVYYGDEIGMHYLDVPTKEGGYQRTGSRTPMQWEKGKVNMGFSTSDAPYLPCEPDGPSVDEQLGVKGSLLETMRELIALRHEHEELQADTYFDVLSEEPFVYRRGRFIIAVNPDPVSRKADIRAERIVYAIGDIKKDRGLVLGPQSFAVVE